MENQIIYDVVPFDEVAGLDVVTWLGHENAIQMAGVVLKNEGGLMNVMTLGGPGQLLKEHHPTITTMDFPDHYRVIMGPFTPGGEDHASSGPTETP